MEISSRKARHAARLEKAASVTSSTGTGKERKKLRGRPTQKRQESTENAEKISEDSTLTDNTNDVTAEPPLSPPPSSVASSESGTTSTSAKENVAPSDTPKIKTSKSQDVKVNSKRKRRRSSGSIRKKTRRISGASSSSTVSEKKSKNKKDEDVSDTDDGDSDSDGPSDDHPDGDNEKEYVVERIVTKRLLQGIEFYYIKWKGWAETANTWEPVENLNGCPKLLEDFEKQWAANIARRKPSMRKRPIRSNKRINDDSENETDPQKVHEDSQANMRSYGVLSTWPTEREPESVEGVISVDGILTYIVKKKTRQHSHRLDRSNAVLVHSAGFRHDYPDLVIRFYQSRIIWGDNNKTDEEKAILAAKMSLLLKNKGSKLGKEVADDLDEEFQPQLKNQDTSRSEDDERSASIELGENDPETQLVDMDQDQDETQKNSESDESDLIMEEVRSPDAKRKNTDIFGLPEDPNLTDTTDTDDDDLVET